MITYKEFEARVKEIDGSLSVKKLAGVLVLKSSIGTLLLIDAERTCSVDSIYPTFEIYEHKQELFELATELAATPLEERVEEQRWHMKSKWLIDEVYLFNKCAGSDETPMLRHVSMKNATAFTRSEIETLRDCFGDVMNHYTENEVTE